jgi:hypothetical protein
MHPSVPIGPTFKANRPFHVYLATGSTVRLTTARPWIEKLQERGFSVYDWTRDSGWDLNRPPTEAELVGAAIRDEDAIASCDLFWYVVPPEKSEGAASELMLAKCYGKSIVGSGDFGSRNIFALRYIRPELRFASEQVAFAYVCEAAERSKSWRGEF